MFSEKEQELRLTMPRSPDGHIVNPRFSAATAWHKNYILAWGKWLREHHKRDWPGFMHEYVRDEKRKKDSAAGKPLLAGGDGGSQAPGDDRPEKPGGVSGQERIDRDIVARDSESGSDLF